MLSVKIKEQTAGSHRQLESHPLFHNLNGNFKEEDYLLLLQKLHAYYTALEKVFVPFLQSVDALQLQKRQRAHLLVDDIKNRSGHVILNNEVPIPVIDSIYKATGALYVMEGSTLGARFICQSLARSGVDASNGGTYFSGYGEETGAMWKGFIQFMNEVASNDAQEKEVIDTAEKVFSTLHNWLDKND